MDPFLLVSLGLIISGSMLFGACGNHLYNESQAQGMWLPFEDYNKWKEWRDLPALGEDLGRSIGDRFREDRAEIRALDRALAVSQGENAESEQLIGLLRERISVLVDERDHNARIMSEKYTYTL